MLKMSISLDGDGCWPDLKGEKAEKLIWLNDGSMSVALLKGGMQSGNHSVAVRLDLPDGRVVVAETSLALFTSAADAMRTRARMDMGPDPEGGVGKSGPITGGNGDA